MAASIPMVGNVAQASYVGTVTLQGSGVYPGNGGGEFTAYTSVDYTDNYDAKALYNNSTGFETFCIETGVEFNFGISYNYSLGSLSQPLSNGGTGSALPLSLGAAWLYYQFGTGNLANYEYAYNTTRQTDDNLLQAAIWTLQGNQLYNAGVYGTGATVANNIYYAAAIAALGGVVNANSAYTGTSVEILQMWDINNGNAAQNQLVLTGGTPPTPHPTPDGGMTVALLGGALVGLGVLRRKLFC